jgi:endonuclease YncB( thermonuclease family)
MQRRKRPSSRIAACLLTITLAVAGASYAAPRQAALPSEFDAVVTRVVDGDTFRFKASLLNVDINDVCRMREYNAPEIKGTEKVAGGKAKSKLIGLIGGKQLRIKTFGKDKYGRWLCTAASGTVPIGAAMREYLKGYRGRDRYLPPNNK